MIFLNLKSFLISIATPIAVCAYSQTAQWQQPQSVNSGRELPRTSIVSYCSTEDAMVASRSNSRYMQPLDSDWAVSSQETAVTFSRGYKVPFEWVDRELFLHIGAVETAYQVLINNRPCGYNQSAMTPAEFDITALSQEGNNTVKIVTYPSAVSRKIENREGLSATGREPRIGQIEGEVYITAQPRVRVRDFVVDARMEGMEGRIELGVVLKSHLLNPKDIRMYYQLYSPVGELVTEGRRDINIDMRKEDTVRFYVAIPQARAWNHETPNLYTLVVKTQLEGRFTEYVGLKIGLRSVEMSHGKLLISSREVPFMVADYAAPSAVKTMWSELYELKRIGINTIKVKAVPQPRAFYEACDIIGLYVCNQADINSHKSGKSLMPGGTPSNDPQWKDAYIDRVMTMYHTSKVHPSVVMFSLAENAANGYNLYESYLRLKQAETARPVIYPDARGEWNSDALSNLCSQDQLNAWGKGLTGQPRIIFGVTPTSDIKVIEPYTITAASEGVFCIHNNLSITTLRNAEVIYTARSGRRIVSQGVLPLEVAAGSSSNFTIERGKAKTGDRLEVEIEVKAPATQPFNYTPTPDKGELKQSFMERLQENLNIKSTQAKQTKQTLAKGSFTTTVL